MLRTVNAKLIRRVNVSAPHFRAAPLAVQNVYGTVNSFHSSARRENELIVAGLTIGAVTMTLQYALKGFAAYASKKAAEKSAAPDGESTSTNTAAENEPVNNTATEEVVTEAKKQADAQHQKRTATGPAKASFFSNLFNSAWFAKNFYDGGFEDKMTKREAALILGVRENATPERIKDAHRRIMQINHPDKGGSAYLTAKVNEAKDMLIKGK